jgi:hypothetical protein
MKKRIIQILEQGEMGLSGLHDKLRLEGFDHADIYLQVGRLYREGEILFENQLVSYTSLSFERKLSPKK